MVVEHRSQLQSRGIVKESPKITEKQFKFLLNNLEKSQRNISLLNLLHHVLKSIPMNRALCHSSDFLCLSFFGQPERSPPSVSLIFCKTFLSSPIHLFSSALSGLNSGCCSFPIARLHHKRAQARPAGQVPGERRRGLGCLSIWIII